MKYRAEIQLLAGCLRIFDAEKEYGEEYEIAATLVWKDSKTVEILGMTSKGLDFQLTRTEVCRAAKELGIEVLQVRRIRRGVDKLVEFSTDNGRLIRTRQ